MSEKPIKENLMGISRGRIPIDRKMELGEDAIIVMKGSIVKKEDLDNQDGTRNVVYIFKSTEIRFDK